MAAVLTVAVLGTGAVFLMRSIDFTTTISANAAFVYDQHFRITPKTRLRLTFPEPMNQESVLEHLYFPTGFAAETSWMKHDLILTPRTELALDETFEIRLGRDALTRRNTPLPRDVHYRFAVAGDPVISLHTPARDATDIAPSSTVTIIFDRPVMPLTQVQGRSSENKLTSLPITISPEVSGRWRWLGTSTAQFAPTTAFNPGTLYTVHIPAGIPVLTGDRTQQDFSFSFTTIRPKILSLFPDGGDTIGPGDSVKITFNTDIDLASARQSIKLWELTPEPVEIPIESILHARKIRLEKGKEVPFTDMKSIVLEPRNPWKFNTSYQLLLQTGLKPQRGTLGPEADRTIEFRTAGDLAVSRAAYEHGAINLAFNNPIDPRTLKGNISITPPVPGFENINLEGAPWDDRNIRFHLSLQPSTAYTVSVRNVRDIWRQTLKDPYSFTFETPKIDPKISFHGNTGNFGIFEKNFPPMFHINSINTSKLDIRFGKLSFDAFLEIQRQKQSSYSEPQIFADETGKQWSIPLENTLNIPEATTLDLEKEHGRPLESGLYFVQASAPEYMRDMYHQGGTTRQPIILSNVFALTNMVITAKYTGNKALVWVTGMQNNAPVAGATVKFINLDGRAVTQGRTDKDGFFELDFDIRDFKSRAWDYKPEFWITAEHNNDFAFTGSNWNRGFEPYLFNIWEHFKGPESKPLATESYLYTERPIYRAGDMVHFKGIVRMFGQQGELFVDSARKANITIHNPEGNELFKKTFSLNSNGSFSGELPLSREAMLGNYFMELRMTPEDDLDRNYTHATFSVLAYRTPEFHVAIEPQKEAFHAGEPVRLDVSGAYYFDAPMAGASVSWRTLTSDYYFSTFTDEWFSFTPYDLDCREPGACVSDTSQRTAGTATLDNNGKAVITLPPDSINRPVSQQVTVEVDITDENNQTVSNRTTLVVHNSSVYVGLRSDNTVIFPNQQATMRLVTLKPDATPAPGQKVALKLYRREWNSVKKRGVDGEFYYDNEPKDTFIREVSATTNDQGYATAHLKVDQGGQYLVLAETRDSSGRVTKAVTWLYVFSDFGFNIRNDQYVNWPHLNTDRLEIIPDKKEYAVGDTARLLVKSPFQGTNVKALVTVEREQIMSRQVIPVTSTAQPFEITITEEMIPNAYVSVLILKPRDRTKLDESGRDSGAPAFRLGYATLNVEMNRKKLDITVSTDKTHYLPGETVKATVTTRDYTGIPVSAEVSLGVVDMGVLALGGFELPDLAKYFYSKRGLGVQTAEMLTYLIERVKPGSKGGGGGDLARRRRGTFLDTAYWNPVISTNNSGEASVEFTLPDNLTTWHLLAIGHTRDNRFGANFTTIVETKKVLVHTVRPRFAVRGDEIEIGAIVYNSTDSRQTFDVSLAGTGFETVKSAPPLERSLTVNASSQHKILFPIRVLDTQQLTFIFKADAGEMIDEIEEHIPVKPWGVRQTTATFGTVGNTENSMTERVFVPSLRDAPTGILYATVSPTLGVYLQTGLEYLVNFPYYCVEQSLSAMLGSIVIRNLQGFEAFHVVDNATLEKTVLQTLQYTYKLQRHDGGFGYFYFSQKSYPYLSAYVYQVLVETRKARFSVDNDAMAKLEGYLRETLRNQDLENRLDLATRAYILFVLSENGKGDSGLISNLSQKSAELPLFARAYLAMAHHNTGSRDRARTMLADIVNHAKIDARGAHFEETDAFYYRPLMHENTITTALMVRLMARVQPQHELLPRTLQYLLAIRRDGRWRSTQSTIHTLMAFVDTIRVTDELNASFTARVGNEQLALIETTFDKNNVLTQSTAQRNFDELEQGKMIPINIMKDGTGTLYYDLVMEYFYTPDEIQPVEEGISITRHMQPVGGAGTKPRASDLYKVTLTVTVPQDRHFVAIESPLPAGFEAVDPNVLTSAQISAEENDEEEDWKSRWFVTREEFRDDMVFIFADSLPTGVYEYSYYARATTPGRYRYLPARAYEMYFPEIFGQTDGGWMEIAP